jgi:spermidine synthase
MPEPPLDRPSSLHFTRLRMIRLALTATGITSIVTQIIFLREFLSVFFGNELVIGMILGCWMVLTAAGAFLGNYSSSFRLREFLLPTLLILMAVIPAGTLFILDYFRNIIFSPGTMVGLTETLWSSLILLAPFCIVSGFTFTIAAGIFAQDNRNAAIAHAYAWESFGSAIGGILYTIITVYFLKVYQTLILLMAFNLFIAWLLAYQRGRKSHYILSGLSIIAIAVLFTLNLDQRTRQFLFPGQEILFWKDTPYGTLTVTRQAEQTNVYENNALEFSTGDAVRNEETVHYAMIQHPAPKNILLISGGISGALQEIMKYNIDRIDYIEINPWIISAGREFIRFRENERVNIIIDDARRYVRLAVRKYDAVLVNLPDPNTVQINRYYTSEFFHDIKRIMAQDAVISFAVSGGTEYSGESARRVGSILYATLKSEFTHILIVPGMKNYFLGSDAPLHIDITRQIDAKKIQTTYVNKYYLEDEMLRERSNGLLKQYMPVSVLNTDFKPIAYLLQGQFWSSQFEYSGWMFGILGAVVLVVLFSRMNTISAGMFTAGFSISSIEVVILIAFQIVYGYVYAVLGILIACFMTGLAVGAYLRRRLFPAVSIEHYAATQIVFALFASLLPVILALTMQWRDIAAVVQMIFYGISFVIAAIAGLEFSMASVLRAGDTSSVVSELYGVDLIGSALGAVITAAFLIPLTGVLHSVMIISVVNIASGLFAFGHRKSFA